MGGGSETADINTAGMMEKKKKNEKIFDTIGIFGRTRPVRVRERERKRETRSSEIAYTDNNESESGV